MDLLLLVIFFFKRVACVARATASPTLLALRRMLSTKFCLRRLSCAEFPPKPRQPVATYRQPTESNVVSIAICRMIVKKTKIIHL